MIVECEGGKQRFRASIGRPGAFWVAIVAIVAWTGCGSKGDSTYPAGGIVKFSDGTAFPGGFVMFRSLDRTPAVTARGEISPTTGEFQMTTFELGDGAVPGKHEALISPPPFKGDRDDVAVVPQIIDRKFTDFATSNLKFEVSSNSADNHFPITVERPPR